MLDGITRQLNAEPGISKPATRTQSANVWQPQAFLARYCRFKCFHTGIQKAIIESKVRATKERPASSRTAPDVLDGVGEAGEEVSAAD
jgi:hypothetical protein